jgi:hypothetical protein
VFDVRKATAKFSTLCLWSVMDAKGEMLSSSQKERVSAFVTAYCGQLLELYPDTSVESQSVLKKFVVERLVLFLQKIRLCVVSGRRMKIKLNSWNARTNADVELAETDARMSAQHLKEFCTLVSNL